MAPRALRVGLTGGIASGKSHVLRRLAADGFRTLDLDRVAHELMAPGGAAHGDVVAAFGASILAPDGAIDRRALGAIVFADPPARLRLNALVHPRVRVAEERWLGEATAGEISVVDAALLVETGLHLRFDRLIAVRCTSEQQMERLRHRDGLDAAAAAARLAAQMDPTDKARFAHHEIDSSGRPLDTDAAVDAVAAALRQVAAAPARGVALPLEQLDILVRRLEPGLGPLPDPPRVLAAATSGALELPELLAWLRPPRTGAWHHAPGPDPDLKPATWAGAAAAGLIAAAWHPGDLEWAAGAGYALGRVAFASAAAHAATALVAVAACALTADRAGADWQTWERLAARFGGDAPHPSARTWAEAFVRS